MSIGVLLADDQAMVRAGFRMILESDPDISVVGEALAATPDPLSGADDGGISEGEP
jgi:DNA-binding NarL/FixJ family response regulator